VNPAILIRHHALLWNLSADPELLQRSFRWTPGIPEICCVPSFRFESFGSVIVACELDRTGATKAFEKECGMYNAKRDSEGGGASHAIPSMGAIEGRITVLEVLAATSLRLLLKEGDKIAAKHALSSIRKAMRAKCNDVHQRRRLKICSRLREGTDGCDPGERRICWRPEPARSHAGRLIPTPRMLAGQCSVRIARALERFRF